MHIPTERILVRPIGGERKSKGGIIIPDEAADIPEKGEVLLVHEGYRKCKAGDVIYYGKFTGHDIKLEGEKLRLIKTEDILLVLD